MALNVAWCDAAKCLHLGEQRTSLVLAQNDANDPSETSDLVEKTCYNCTAESAQVLLARLLVNEWLKVRTARW